MIHSTKRYLFAALLFTTSSVITVVQAQPYDVYMSGNIGIAMPVSARLTDSTDTDTVFKLPFDNSVMLTGAIGLRGGQYRSELEIAYQKNDLKDNLTNAIIVAPANPGVDITGNTGDMKVLAGMVNAYFDFNTANPQFSPYITGGIGMANVDWASRIDYDDGVDQGSFIINNDDTAFAFQLGTGVGISITESVILDLRYRYFSVPSVEFETIKTRVKSHNFSGGLRVFF